MKIAVASAAGKNVTQHFGGAHLFHIFMVAEDGSYQFLESRDNTPPCQHPDAHDDMLAQSAARLADCRYVIVSRIGPGALETLTTQGIQAVVIHDFIEQAVERLIALQEKGTFRE